MRTTLISRQRQTRNSFFKSIAAGIIDFWWPKGRFFIMIVRTMRLYLLSFVPCSHPFKESTWWPIRLFYLASTSPPLPRQSSFPCLGIDLVLTARRLLLASFRRHTFWAFISFVLFSPVRPFDLLRSSQYICCPFFHFFQYSLIFYDSRIFLSVS